MAYDEGSAELLRETLGDLTFVEKRMFGGVCLMAICSILDDHIAPRRSAFFMEKLVLRDIRDGVRPC
jgi:hypothetical protein